jgi:hypothetical protein
MSGSTQDNFMQSDNVYEEFIEPTKTESRTSETQQRMYSHNGPGFMLELFFQGNGFPTLEKPTAQQSLTLQISELTFSDHQSSFPKAA